MAVPFILSSFFVNYIYPLLLVFTLLFAVLDKTKILGEGKRQINAIISLVIALIFITFGNAVGIVVRLMPFLAVLLVIILVFYLLMGFIWNDKAGFEAPKGVKIAGAVIVFVALVIAILVITNYWENVLGVLRGESTWASSIFFIIIIVAALVAVLWKGKT